MISFCSYSCANQRIETKNCTDGFWKIECPVPAHFFRYAFGVLRLIKTFFFLVDSHGNFVYSLSCNHRLHAYVVHTTLQYTIAPMGYIRMNYHSSMVFSIYFRILFAFVLCPFIRFCTIKTFYALLWLRSTDIIHWYRQEYYAIAAFVVVVVEPNNTWDPPFNMTRTIDE